MHGVVEASLLLLFAVLYWTNRGRRRYLHRRIGPAARGNVLAVARNFAYMICRRPVRLHDACCLLRPGCILYSVHYGLWELMPGAVRKKGYQVGVLVNRYALDRDSLTARLADRILTRYRRRGGVTVFDQDDTMRITRFLQQGGVLGVLVDGNTPYAKMPKIERLARVCRVPAIPFAAYRSGGGGIVYIGCDLGNLLHERPHDYMWFYRSRTA